MPRKGEVRRREVLPDPKYNDRFVTKFINSMMYGGKKSTAEHILYDALDMVAERTKEDPLAVFKRALENVKPNVEVRSKRVGGANYQVPMQVTTRRQQSLAIRWILSATRGKSGRPMATRLADELMAAFRREGDAMTMRENVHRMAEANKAFSHFAW